MALGHLLANPPPVDFEPFNGLGECHGVSHVVALQFAALYYQ
jgi:hypothetical protein